MLSALLEVMSFDGNEIYLAKNLDHRLLSIPFHLLQVWDGCEVWSGEKWCVSLRGGGILFKGHKSGLPSFPGH